MLRPVKIKHYISVMSRHGFDAEQVLEGSGLELGRLSDSACLVDLHQCRTVVSNMIRLTGNQSIGFEMGEHSSMADFGIIAHAMMSSKTLRQAIGYWMQYSNLVGMLIRLTLQEEDGSWVIVFSETEPLGFVYNFCVEEILVTGIKLGSALVGQPLDVSRIRLSYPAPLHAELYRETFDCAIQFNARHTSITVRSPGLDTLLPSKDDELNEIFRRHCTRVMRQVAANDTVSSRLRSLLMTRSGAPPSLAQAARLLGMSARTLRRHLHSERSSYQNLIDEVRLDIATEYLRSDDLAAKEIGFLLGFRDTNSFRRAFKSWSGQTIQQYRETLRGALRTSAKPRYSPTAQPRRADS